MSYVTTLPEALAAAAGQLEGIESSFTAESSAAAAPTTDVIPAAADSVSILQAGVFSTYGQLYQSVSAQAQAIQQQFVSLLGTSAGSYGDTEAANNAAAGSSGLSSLAGGSSAGSAAASSTASTATDPIEWMSDQINNATTYLTNSPLNSNIANLSNIQVGNWASASSDLIGMGGGGLLTALAGPVAGIGGLGAGLAGSVTPAAAGVGAAGGLGAAPVLAGVGQGSSIGALSVPPSWAGGAPVASTPMTLASQSWATAAPHTGQVTTLPATMPGAAGAGRGGTGFGAPRYGVKPKVMPAIPKPTIV